MIESGAGICVYKYEVEQIKRFCLFFTYLLSFPRGGIRQKVFMLLPQRRNFLREKLETVNKSISKKVETFEMFLDLQNGKYVSNFIY